MIIFDCEASRLTTLYFILRFPLATKYGNDLKSEIRLLKLDVSEVHLHGRTGMYLKSKKTGGFPLGCILVD